MFVAQLSFFFRLIYSDMGAHMWEVHIGSEKGGLLKQRPDTCYVDRDIYTTCFGSRNLLFFLGEYSFLGLWD